MSARIKAIFQVFLLSASFALLPQAGAQGSSPLEQGFEQPPASARPRVWWHWMNGNITKEGIKLDLEWMHRIGLGGFQNFDAALNTPKLVDQRLVYMTPEWKDAFHFATQLADQLGLEEAIAGSPGWSESGGPWVKPSQAMKKFVWSETVVEGGKPFSGALPKPPTVSGPYQDIPLFNMLAAMTGQPQPKLPEYFADSAVVAYRLPEGGLPAGDLKAKVTSSGGSVDPAVLTDGDFVKAVKLPKAPVGEQSWIQFEFDRPQALRAFTFSLSATVSPFAAASASGVDFEASDDGNSFRKIANVPNDGAQVHTISFPATTARFFRLAFTTMPPPPPRRQFDTDFNFGLPPANEYSITEMALHADPRVNRVEEKAAFAPLQDLYPFPTPAFVDAEAISKNDVVDLTSKMRPDGTLDWTPPQGRWIVLRLGYSLRGITNHPASPEGTGLEVDKLNPQYVKVYMETYLDNYQSAVGPLMGKRGLQYVINDSWEAGAQNWTDNLIAEFTKRRGYDPHPWLPVLTGRVVESSSASDRFLWDFRRTLADLVAEYHYDEIEKILKARGMGHYVESHESRRALIADGMEVKRSSDVPMSAMWTQKPGVNEEQYGYNADIRESASVAHLYGQNLVAAESLTAASGAWAWSPATLKPTADKEMAMGLNRFVIHTSVHQPLLDRKPGLSLGPFGQWFTRNETWAELAKPWITYLTRSSYLLQQGRFFADIAYFYGEDSNLTALFANKSPDVPPGYNFDYINADSLIHLLSVKDGELSAPSGMKYRVLALDPYSKHMSLPVLRKIRDLVQSGAVVAGAKPTDTPSLEDDAQEFQRLAGQLWGADGKGASVGKGRVYGDQDLASVLAGLHLPPDFEYTKPEPDTNLLFVHRRTADGDLYFVDNRNDRNESLDATFRVQGKAAELWHPDTGKIEPASYKSADGRTTVPLRLEPWGTVFVVFRQAAKSPSRTLTEVAESAVGSVEGPWKVSFQPDRGAPPKVTMEKLSDWSESSEQGVKYFSGTATYEKSVDAPGDWFTPGSRIWIDLGEVKNLAEVAVNGKPLGLVWKKPYRVDATEALKPGANTLQVKVTNGWANRIIGDRQPNVEKEYTFTSPKFYKADSPLWPSGLLGPVKIVRTTQSSSARGSRESRGGKSATRARRSFREASERAGG